MLMFMMVIMIMKFIYFIKVMKIMVVINTNVDYNFNIVIVDVVIIMIKDPQSPPSMHHVKDCILWNTNIAHSDIVILVLVSHKSINLWKYM